MVLKNINITNTGEVVQINIVDDLISQISQVSEKEEPFQLIFDNAQVFPGIINAHDHLDFNLFPQLGNKVYNNYTEWGNYIHRHYKTEIAEVLKIPVSLRTMWGLYKNLLAGVTTVINHGEKVNTPESPISVYEETHVLHSVQFQKNWQLKLNSPLKIRKPVIIHAGEGTDQLAHHEINTLLNWNLLHRKLVAIHGVAMTGTQAKKFEALVWCPQSNFFLLDSTARIDLLKRQTSILFGTDSTLTGHWDFWEHLKLARKTGLMTDEELFATTNQNAAQVFRLPCGEIKEGKLADLAVARNVNSGDTWSSFFSLDPAGLLLVIHHGNIRMFDESLLPQLKDFKLINFSRIILNGAVKYVQGDLPGLIKNIRKYYQQAQFPVSFD